MFKIKTNAMSKNGNLRNAVRVIAAENVEGLTLTLSNGTEAKATRNEGGFWAVPIAETEDGIIIYAKLTMTIAANDDLPKATIKVPIEVE